MSRRFALLDRDGTINVERNHLGDPDEVELIPGSAAAIVRLRALGLGIVVVTNQAHVGRGLLTEDRLAAIHARLAALLAAEGAEVDAILWCPHRPEDGCACRKPGIGMAEEAARRFGFDPARSFVVGDHAGDVGMGRAIGATTFLVRTGHGREEAEAAAALADHVVADLAAATDIIAALVSDEGATGMPGTMDADATREAARDYFATLGALVEQVREGCLDDVASAAALLTRTLQDGGKLLICGNGGSAADAQHLATEFVSTLTIDHPRPSIPAIALTTDTSLLTAIANDFGIEGVFSRQVASIGRAGDCLIAISTSGNSANVVRAAEEARVGGIRVVALTGASGGRLAPLADVAVRVPSDVTAHIQECHLAIEQSLALLVERALYP